MKTKAEVAKDLIEYHVRTESGIVRAFRYERKDGDRTDEPVKLLEVSQSTVPAGVLPIYFGPSTDTPFPVVIVELTEDEFQSIRQGDMNLPEGWDVAETLHQSAA